MKGLVIAQNKASARLCKENYFTEMVLGLFVDAGSKRLARASALAPGLRRADIF
jgi:hypothetical protein